MHGSKYTDAFPLKNRYWPVRQLVSQSDSQADPFVVYPLFTIKLHPGCSLTFERFDTLTRPHIKHTRLG
jgi:hypothetical protein